MEAMAIYDTTPLHRLSRFPEMSPATAMALLRALQRHREALQAATACNDHATAAMVAEAIHRDEARLLVGHGRFVIYTIRSVFYGLNETECDDVFQEAALGALTAVRRFDFGIAQSLMSDGFNGDSAMHKVFLTTMRHWVRRNALRWRHERWRGIRLPVHIEMQLAYIARAAVVLAVSLEPQNYATIAAWVTENTRYPLTEAKVAALLTWRQLLHGYLSTKTSDAGGDTSDFCFLVGADDTGYDAIEDRDEHQWEAAIVGELLSELTDGQREAVELYHGFDGKAKTLRECADTLGVSRQAVLNRLNSAYAIMRVSDAAQRYQAAVGAMVQ